MELTTLSQFGARLSLAKLHVKKLLDASRIGGKAINHVFYLVDPTNKQLNQYLESIAGSYANVTLLSRADNDWTDFGRLKKKAPYGGDCNYDFLIRRPETKDVFLTLHDDAIIQTPNLYDQVMAALTDVDFAGFVDSRGEIDTYRRIIMDGEKMSDIRLGTWFTIGKKEIYLKNKYRIGDYRNYWKYYLHAKYGFTPRLRFLDQKVWLNGGFDFNIRARLDGHHLKVLDRHPEFSGIATHLTKITGFFAATKRNMLRFADSKDEVTKWKEYSKRLYESGNSEQIEFDRNFMLELSSTFEQAGIPDELLNRDTIMGIFEAKRDGHVAIARHE